MAFGPACFGRVQLQRQPAPLAGRGVLVDRTFGSGLGKPAGHQAQLGLRLAKIPAAERGGKALHLDFEGFLTCTIASAALEALADALLRRQRMGHLWVCWCRCLHTIFAIP